MLISLSIRNFGSVKETQTLSFEADNTHHLEKYYVLEPIKGLRLLKLGLIYGANASGKTTILKSLDFLRDLVLAPEDKKTDELTFDPFLFDENTPNESSSIYVEFIQNAIRYAYDIEFNKNAILKENLFFYNPNKATVFKRTTDTEKQLSEISFGKKIKVDKSSERGLESNTLWNNTVLGGSLKTNTSVKEIDDVILWFKDYLKSIILPETNLRGFVSRRIENSEKDKNELIGILQQADFNITDVVINKEEGEKGEGILNILRAANINESEIEKIKKTPLRKVLFEHVIKGEQYLLPIDKESKGTQRYYAFAGILNMLVKESILVPVDEIDSSLHPDLFIHFLLSFIINSKSSQLLATTHNREVLNNRDIFRNDSIWFTEKNEIGATELYSLSDFDSSVIRDSSNIFNAYKAGKLGGVPNLGDIFVQASDED